MSKKYNKKYVYGAVALATVAMLAGAIPALADNTVSTTAVTSAWVGQGRAMGHGRALMKPGIFGKVTAISGTAITVSGKQGFGKTATDATFTVDASNAKITKDNAAGSVSSITVGDTIMAEGTLTGTNLVATMIHDGVMNRGMGGGIRGSPGANGASGMPSPITGNGMPVVAGTVSTVSGNTITITNKSNVTYTIDATNAKIVQGQNTVAVSSIAVGDAVVVQGTVNGNSIVASSVIDQQKPASSGTSSTGAQVPHKSFFGGIGSFFSHIFGF